MKGRIHEEAADWLVEFRAGEVTASVRAEFDAWLRQSPQHIRAYLELSARWEAATQAAQRDPTSVEELIARARADSALAVVAIGGEIPAVRETWREHRPRNVAARVALVCAAVLIGSAALWFVQFRGPSYSTGLGEQRSITLADGSVVQMNSRSQIRVRYSAKERGIELLDGQALFEVAKDRSRPFVVYSGTARVSAVGTEFDVYRQTDRTTVTVIEGTVSVSGAQSASPAVAPASFVKAGDQVIVTSRELQPPTHSNVSATTAWTQRRLVFQATSLPQVAEEFNRYNTRRLVVEGRNLDSFLVSGVFSSADPTSLLRFLREQTGIQVTETDAEIRISRR